LAEGQLSQRQIAGRLGISRGSVASIASGKRPDYEARRAEREPESVDVGPPIRCPGCGHMQFMPCRVCRDRAALWAALDVQKAARRPAGAERSDPDDLNLQLRPEHAARYDPIHRALLKTDPAHWAA